MISHQTERKLLKQATLSAQEARCLVAIGYQFRPATLYSPQHTKDPVVYILDASGKRPFHISKGDA